MEIFLHERKYWTIYQAEQTPETWNFYQLAPGLYAHFVGEVEWLGGWYGYNYVYYLLKIWKKSVITLFLRQKRGHIRVYFG